MLQRMRCVFFAFLLVAGLSGPAWADGGTLLDDGGFPMLPDASVNNGTPDPSEEGEDGQMVTFCRSSADCGKGFTCVDAQCTWRGYRLATCTCGSGAGPMMGVAALLLLVWRTRR